MRVRPLPPLASSWIRPLSGRPWQWVVGLLLIAAPLISTAEIIDRVVAVVGEQAITSSEVDMQLRLEALFNREPLEITPQKRQQALQRLIAVRVIQSEAVMAGFLRSSEEEVRLRLRQSQRDRYVNGLGFEQALKFYDLKEQDVTDFWRQVTGFERFKDFRFKTGLEVSSETVEAYYREHIVPEFRGEANGAPPPLGEIYDRVEEAAIEKRANELLDEWLKETRPQLRIVILEEQNPPPEPNGAGTGAAAADSQAVP